MSHAQRVGVGLVLLAAVLGQGRWASGQADDPKSLWEDFNHYVLIARPELAEPIGRKLLELDEQTLLDVVEASSYRDLDAILFRAARIDTLKAVSDELRQKIQAARLTRSREEERIQADIMKLGEGARPYMNALERLKSAGQYAAPALLDALQNESKKTVHPFILSAIVAIGRPLVYPLAVALPHLEPVQQTQLSQALAEIGYPRALPYLREVMENERTDPSVRQTAAAAYRHLAETAGLPANVTAAELYLLLAQNHYNAAARGEPIAGYDPADGTGIVWEYRRGLIPVPVPGPVYGYVLAMRASMRSLQLNADLSPSLSLWLMANLVRENRLPADQKDPSYGSDMREPSFYLRAAGPLRQHDVLARALGDRDPILALDAIAGLAATAGTDALVNREGTVQPLIAALTYPDRRVRFNAAFALTNARPKSAFPGSHRIVPILAEAIRQSDVRYALVIARDKATTDALAAVLREDMGMQTIAGQVLDEVMEAVAAGPGIDLVVAHLDIDTMIELQRQRTGNYKLAAAPMLAMVSTSSELVQLNSLFGGEPSVLPMAASTDTESIRPAIEQAIKTYAGAPLDPAEAEAFATTALQLLREIALGSDSVFRVMEAQPALIQAINDPRDAVAILASQVLAMLDSVEAQQAIGEAALDTTRASTLRIPMLNSLADSAKSFGNRLGDAQLEKLLKLVDDKATQAELALAAARAHGALTLPTANVVQMITR